MGGISLEDIQKILNKFLGLFNKEYSIDDQIVEPNQVEEANKHHEYPFYDKNGQPKYFIMENGSIKVNLQNLIVQENILKQLKLADKFYKQQKRN